MSLETNAFDVTLRASRPDEPEVTLTGLQSVTTTAGMPVQPWDMHVGAVLETLGKFIVLRSCSAETGAHMSRDTMEACAWTAGKSSNVCKVLVGTCDLLEGCGSPVVVQQLCVINSKSILHQHPSANLKDVVHSVGLWLSKKARLVIALKEELLVEFRKYNQESFAPAMLNTRGVGGGRLAHSYTEGIELQAQARVAIQAVADQVRAWRTCGKFCCTHHS